MADKGDLHIYKSKYVCRTARSQFSGEGNEIRDETSSTILPTGWPSSVQKGRWTRKSRFRALIPSFFFGSDQLTLAISDI